MTTAKNSGPAALRATAMTKSFGDKVAVENVDLTLLGGEIHALLGENGAGKSTLISMLSGQYRPDAGDIEVDGRPVRFTSPKHSLEHGIGVVYQDFRLVDDFTVLENLVLGTSHRPSRAAWKRAQEVMDSVGFDLPRDVRIDRLSVGEKQQLEILKLLFRGANILILDEPTAVLTPQQSLALFDALRILADQGKAIMFVSHKLREVAQAADRVTVLRKGRTVASQLTGEADDEALAALMMGTEVARGDDTVVSHEPGEQILSLVEVSTTGESSSSLSKVSLTIRRKEIVGVAGVSGNGQADLAAVAAGLIQPAHGTRHNAAESVAYVPEDRLAGGLVGQMSIAENLALRNYRDLYSPLFVSRGTMERRAAPLIETFAIPASPSTKAGELSGGGQQRTILARELSADPDLLVVCQPTRGLDIASARAIHRHLLKARERGGVLLMSEDLDELLRLSDRVVVILQGRLVAEFDRDQADRVRIGSHMTGAHDQEGAA